MSEFVVAIPSYKRAHILMKCTFALCVKWSIPHHRIHVFVTPEDVENYQQVLQNYPEVHIHVGPVGLHSMRNHIAQTFPENTPILQMDDDIKDLYELQIQEHVEDELDHRRYALRSMPADTMMSWIQNAFDYTRTQGASLFGIYPVKNGYFMKDSPPVTRKLSFCVGVFWGIWNRRDLQLQIQEKEDFERTLWCYERDGIIIRYNWITPATTYYRTEGGMQAQGVDRKLASVASCKYLMEKWPQWCRLYTSKKSGMHEVRLRA